MLETIRQFAAECLEVTGDAERTARRHAQWHVVLAERLETLVRYGDADSTARLTAEIDNMRSALEWLAREQEVGQAMLLIDGLWYFWITRGLVAEGLRWADWAVAQASRAPHWERVLGLLDASELYRFFGNRKKALRIKRELLPQLREMSPERLFPATLADLADMLAEAGEFEEARQLGNEAVAWQRSLGVPSGVGHALSNLGMVEFRAGEFDRARELNEEAAGLFEDPFVPTKLAVAALLAGEAARRAGDPEGARLHLRQALQLCRELDQRGAFPELLQEVAAASPPDSDAARLLGASESLQADMGVPRWEPEDYERTATTLRAELGDSLYEEARDEGASLPADEALSLAARCLD